MSKSRIRGIMQRTNKATRSIQSGLNKIGTTVKRISTNASPRALTRVFGALKSSITRGARQLRGIGKTIKLRSRGMSRARGRGRGRGRSKSRGRGRN